LSRLDTHPDPAARGLFDGSGEVVVARAPGRLDVMGGIADYSGSLVLELPSREATLVALQRQASRALDIVSLGWPVNDRTGSVHMYLDIFETREGLADYGTARTLFAKDPETHWSAFAAGCFLVLMREKNFTFQEGTRILIVSDVPEGKGVSSSAALEVAVMQAVCAAFEIQLEPREAALYCQMVENLVVGAPCGVMDQMTSMCGEANRFLSLLCQPAEIQGLVPIPGEIVFFGLDSGVRHKVSGEDYGSVRTGAFMGYRMIAELEGLAVEESRRKGLVRISDPVYGGYLANVTPDAFASRFAEHLPERMEGKDFLDRFKGTTDTMTRVDPGRSYLVRNPTAHPVYEHFRVRAFSEMLSGPPAPERFEQLGELMFESHASYSACGLGCAETDLLVDLVRAAGPAEGLFGAKITGGGSGGTVAVLGRSNAGGAIESVAEQFKKRTGHAPHIFSGSSPGAKSFGVIRLKDGRST
jgi:L-arabinokinase